MKYHANVAKHKARPANIIAGRACFLYGDNVNGSHQISFVAYDYNKKGNNSKIYKNTEKSSQLVKGFSVDLFEN